MSNKNNSKKKIDKNLKSIINILNKNKIDYWVCHGTLLGIIRDKKLLPWDHDIDIGLLEKNINKKALLNLMEKNGFQRINKTSLKNDGMFKFIKKGGKEIDFNFYKIDKSKKNVFIKWHVPKNLFMRIIDVLSFSRNYSGNYSYIINYLSFSQNFFLHLKKVLIKNDFFYSFSGYCHKINYATSLKWHNFFGLKIMIPNEYKKYFEDLYGVTWRKPLRNYNWTKHSPSTVSYNN